MFDNDKQFEDERAILNRLARVHQEWRDKQPRPVGATKSLSEIARDVVHELENPEPPDSKIIREARQDSIRAAVWSQLMVVGWRLYARGDVELLTQFYGRIERDYHPSFVWMVSRAWKEIGFADDARGVWSPAKLL